MEAAKPNLKLLLALLTPAGAALKAGMAKAGTELMAPSESESASPRLLPNAGSAQRWLFVAGASGDEQLPVPAPKARADEVPATGPPNANATDGFDMDAADGPHVEVAPNADAAGPTRKAGAESVVGGAKSKRLGPAGASPKAGNVAAPNSAAPSTGADR